MIRARGEPTVNANDPDPRLKSILASTVKLGEAAEQLNAASAPRNSAVTFFMMLV